jgi:hypothetical protein
MKLHLVDTMDEAPVPALKDPLPSDDPGLKAKVLAAVS